MTRFVPRLDVLPEAQRRLWPLLRPALGVGFVLYGGTAIALRLGHRISVDFDFFRETPLDYAELYAAMPFLARAQVIQEQPAALSVLVSEEGGAPVKLSFFGPVRFGRVGVPDLSDDGVMQVASLDDLMATKLKVILQRAEVKDYRDIAAMLRADVALDKGLAAAEVMFRPALQPSESLKALTYFDGGDLDALSVKDKSLLISAVNAVSDLPSSTLLSSRLAV